MMKKVGTVLFSLILFSVCFTYFPDGGVMPSKSSAGFMISDAALSDMDPGILLPGLKNIDPGMLIYRDTNIDPGMLIVPESHTAP